MFKKRMFTLMNAAFTALTISSQAWAATEKDSTDDPLVVTKDFSTQMLAIVQGPVLKLLAAVVLLVGVVGLLRGRHKLAISCGLAFLLLLFLPILLGHV